jgi:hypothetical protein
MRKKGKDEIVRATLRWIEGSSGLDVPSKSPAVKLPA